MLLYSIGILYLKWMFKGCERQDLPNPSTTELKSWNLCINQDIILNSPYIDSES